MRKDSKIYIAGHTGLVGSAILRSLKLRGFNNLLIRSHDELDLLNQASVMDFFSVEKPEYVVLAAAKVGGIAANNKYRADFIYENLMIQNNVIHQSYLSGVRKLLFLGSTCVYPKDTKQPILEDYLLGSSLEYTNEPYAIAKIAGIRMCESYNLQYETNFISIMPTNLYGPNDNFDLEKSHVIPALIRKMYLSKLIHNKNWEAIRLDIVKNPIVGISSSSTIHNILTELQRNGIKEDCIEIWGTGNIKREFLWSEDMADACIFLLENVDFIETYSNAAEIRNTQINVGTGIDISIRELAFKIKKIVGYQGDFYFNTEKPDGTIQKLTDISKINKLGWIHTVTLDEGLEKLYNQYIV